MTHLKRYLQKLPPWSLKSAANILILLLASGVLVQNIYLSRRVRALARTSIERDSVQPRSRLGAVSGFDLNGKLRVLKWPNPDGKRFLIITLSSACPVCVEMQPRWRALAATLRPKGDWEIVWISLSSQQATRAFASAHGIPPGEVLVHPDYLAARSLKMDTVPQMLAVTDKGEVANGWVGHQPWSVQDITSAVDKVVIRQP